MTGWRKRTIMEMAREAGAIEMRDNDSMGWGCEFELHQLEAFAKLVREDALAQPEPVQDTEAHYKAVVEGVQKLFNDKRTQPAPVQEPVKGGMTDQARDLAERMRIETSNLGNVDYHRWAVMLQTAATMLDNLTNTPPAAQREFVGLTDEEMSEIWADQKRTGESITRAIEAKLKEKNNG